VRIHFWSTSNERTLSDPTDWSVSCQKRTRGPDKCAGVKLGTPATRKH
jgi:hypothetical protein